MSTTTPTPTIDNQPNDDAIDIDIDGDEGNTPNEELRSRSLKVLVLGDGNFSFSLALARQHYLSHRKRKKTPPQIAPISIELVATSYDSVDEVFRKYPESIGVLQKLRKLNATIYHDIDATKITQTLDASIHQRKLIYSVPTNHSARNDENTHSFDTIWFNQPHTGIESIAIHRSLIAHFFHSALHVLAPDGIIMVTLSNIQRIKWKLEESSWRLGLCIVDLRNFNPAQYEGYEWKRHQAGRTFKVSTMDQITLCRESEKLACSERVKQMNPPRESQPTPSFADKHPCHLCVRMFTSERGLFYHRREMHRPLFSLISEEEEVKVSHNTTDNESQIVPSVVPIVDLQSEDEPETVSSNSWQCHICLISFATEEDLSAHMEGIVPTNPLRQRFHCDFCGREFPNERALYQHNEAYYNRPEHANRHE